MNPSSYLRQFALAALVLLGSIASGSAVTLVSQEQAIANYIISNPNQGRPTLILDPVIEAVARARAKDMAVRNYFSHVNPDGVAANYLLRQAGYVLPASWPTDPAENNVESIAAGYASPSDTWTAWMNSPDHKVHLLGQNAFYATETHYGVGYYYDANSTYKYYWVVITAPPEPVEITTPAPATTATSATISVAGITDPGTSPAAVQFRVENTSGTSAYQVATGVTNWSGTATGLITGANIIRAQSLDGSGNVIGQTTCSVSCLIEGTLSVSVNGSGSVTTGFAGSTARAVGSPITVSASPAPGNIFTGWTGSIVSGSDSLKFTMQDGLALQANFKPNPFLVTSGGYYGILSSGSGAQNGLVRINLTASGIFTGKVLIPGAAWSFSGKLDLNGEATVTIPRTGQSPLVITVQADLTGGSGQISGSVSDGTDSFGFNVSQATFNAQTNAAPQAGRYTLVLASDPSETGTSTPQGNGYATIVVGANGAATVTGCLADGSPFSAMANVANDGTLAVYCVPSGAPVGSSIEGLLTFRSTQYSDLDGTLSWTKAPRAADVYYPGGFSTQLQTVGSAYVRPGTGLDALNLAPGAATAGFGDGNLTQPVDAPVVISPLERATMAVPGAPNVNLAINPVSGLVTGSFVMPNGNLTRAVRGVVLQKQQAAYGYFRGIDQSGYFALGQD